ncbi:AAA family ATPase [Clavibacter michiganensis]|uniref:AAA family ATPase n=1 Tax=Clavibacter michiganensis TaxID=28447 RepID=UPI0015E351AA|nr:AAA family ATPase [Clavibacter michiganensis]
MNDDYFGMLGLSRDDHGDADAFSLAVDRLTFKSSDSHAIPTSGVTVIVGGNSTGKSTILREIRQSLGSQNESIGGELKVLDSVTTERSGSASDAIAWFATRASGVNTMYGGFERNELGGSIPLPLSAIRDAFSNPHSKSQALHYASKWVTLLATPRERAGATAPVARRSDFGDIPIQPVHHFQDSRALVDELNQALLYIFGQEVTLDTQSANIGFRFGRTTVPAPPIDDISIEYRENLTALPWLEEQGDGFVSAMGLLMPLITNWVPIVLIDEPEAFLHPPQAYRLGKMIMLLTKTRRGQVVVATHDQNFLAGILSASTEENSATVLRLDRVDNVTRGHQVRPDDIKEVWSKPQLRFSNVLDGVFHDAVVVAENDRDCLFYESAVDGSCPDSGLRLMYTPCYGKNGAPEIIKILRSASIPTVVVLDLDALREKTLIKKLVAELNQSWSDDIDRLFDIATAEFRTPRRPRKVREVEALITEALGGDGEATYTSDMRKNVASALSLDDPWQMVKAFGIDAFRAENQQAHELLDVLASKGIVLVKVGELEGFGRGVKAAKGSAWVPTALEQGAHRDRDAIEMASAIMSSVAMMQSSQAYEGAPVSS